MTGEDVAVRIRKPGALLPDPIYRGPTAVWALTEACEAVGA